MTILWSGRRSWKALSLLGGLIVGQAAVAQSDPSGNSLKAAFSKDFLVGAALNANDFRETSARRTALIADQFSSISPEDALKWGSIHPQPDRYDFEKGDQYVAFGERHHMAIIGHTLVWHGNTPAWVFVDEHGAPASRELLLQRLHEHIQAVVGRYKGRIKGWDVVNEALNSDGSMRASPWLKLIGPDYVEKAFAFAHEADPSAELYYNDFSLEGTKKRQGALTLIRHLQSLGIPVAAVGLQNHDRLDWPSVQEEAETIEDFAKLGVKVNVTELDIDVLPTVFKDPTVEVPIDVKTSYDATLDPYRAGLPAAQQKALADRYAALFQVWVQHRAVMERVTFWNVTNDESWLNNWPIKGRVNYPLLFDRDDQPTPAYQAVLAVGQAATP